MVECPAHVVLRRFSPAQTTRHISRRSACTITVLDIDVQAAMTILILAKFLTRTLILRLLFLLARTKAIVGFDALLEVLDEHFVRVQHNTHQNPSNPSL